LPAELAVAGFVFKDRIGLSRATAIIEEDW
jgi:hypothetical protein